MSHEIRTPLTGILGYAEMIANYCKSDDERRNYLPKIRRCADALTELINEILDLSKVEAGTLRVENIEASIRSEVENAIALLKPSAAEKRIALEVTYDQIPEKIITDPTRLRQILLNLVGNAIKFTEMGSVQIKIHTERSLICFSITDTGCGLSTEEQSRLFEPFVQADSSTTRKFGGTGLGLALSRRLAIALSGDLHLKWSEPGKGSTFVLRLPTQGASATKSPQSPEKQMVDLTGLRILVAEDNGENRELLHTFLTGNGAMVDLASNGREAVAKALSSRPDVVLMDMQMPEVDGIQATTDLRQRGFLKPIIALTAFAMSDEKKRCLAAGCNDFLAKPFDVPQLLRSVAQYGRGES